MIAALSATQDRQGARQVCNRDSWSNRGRKGFTGTEHLNSYVKSRCPLKKGIGGGAAL